MEMKPWNWTLEYAWIGDGPILPPIFMQRLKNREHTATIAFDTAY